MIKGKRIVAVILAGWMSIRSYGTGGIGGTGGTGGIGGAGSAAP